MTLICGAFHRFLRICALLLLAHFTAIYFYLHDARGEEYLESRKLIIFPIQTRCCARCSSRGIWKFGECFKQFKCTAFNVHARARVRVHPVRVYSRLLQAHTRQNVIAWRVHGSREVMLDYVYRSADIRKRCGKCDNVTFGRSDAQFISLVAYGAMSRAARASQWFIFGPACWRQPAGEFNGFNNDRLIERVRTKN